MISLPDRPLIRDREAPTGIISSPVGVDLNMQGTVIAEFQIALTGLALAAAAVGARLDGPIATLLCCGAILLLGLPHGALDMVALLRSPARSRAVGYYVGLAGSMAALWYAAPGAALLLFFTVAIGHFGEDWPGPGLIANGGALALLAAPLLFHRHAVDSLFAVIAGKGAIPPLADSLLLVAPVAMAAGLTACTILWSSGQRVLATSSAAALAGMLWLPPLAGFALVFGLFHSPRQFARGVIGIKACHWWAPVTGASVASLLLVALVAVSGSTTLSDGMLRGTFVVLSVLTVPHMMIGLVLRWAQTGSNARLATAG